MRKNIFLEAVCLVIQAYLGHFEHGLSSMDLNRWDMRVSQLAEQFQMLLKIGLIIATELRIKLFIHCTAKFWMKDLRRCLWEYEAKSTKATLCLLLRH